jgi:Mitochondrial carrier protein
MATKASNTSITWEDVQAGIKRWALAAVSACIAETSTFPIDFCKTRLQLQNELGKTMTGEVATKQLGMVSTFSHIYKTEGLFAMYNGLPAAALRQAVYGGLGIGLYVPVRALVIGDMDPKDAPVYKRILAGMITGGVGQAIASPTDVVKVRLQADGRLRLLGQPTRYNGTIDAFSKIWREEGLSGYYKGLGPSVQRAAIINGCGIASYDHTKQIVLKLTGKTEGLVPQVVGALVSGLVSAGVSTPFDVVKTRIMNQAKGANLYKGPIDCAVKTVKAEGIFALYKGFTPAYMRLGPWQLVFFVTFEQVNKLASVAQM